MVMSWRGRTGGLSAGLALTFAAAWSAGSLGQQAPPGGAAGASAQKGSGIIIGQVVDAVTDRPIPEAVVSMNMRPGAPMPGAAPATPVARGSLPQDRVMTGADGRFVFYALGPGTYMFTANAPGYSNGSIGQTRLNGAARPIQLEADGHVMDAKIRLWRTATVSGIVVDEAGEPAVRVDVRLMRRTMTAGRARFARAASVPTDDRGVFRIASIQPGDYIVGVPAVYSTMPAAILDSMMQGVASGSGVGGGLLDLLASGGQPPNANALRIGEFLFSSGVGAANLPGPPPGADGRLAVYQSIFYPSTAMTDEATVLKLASGDERSGVNIQLRLVPTVAVSGTVTGPEGPVANVGVRLVRVGDETNAESLTDSTTAATAADGTFTFLGVPPGQYTARVQKMPRPQIPAEMAGNPLLQMAFGPGGPPAGAPTPPLYGQAAIAVGSTDVTGLALRLAEGARLSGRVEFEGASPAPSAQAIAAIVVNVTALDGSAPGGPLAARFGGGGPGQPGGGRSGQADDQGRFRTQGYPIGRYFVSSTPIPGGRGGGPTWTLKSVMAGGRDVSVEPLDLGTTDITDVVVTYTDRVGQITGTVRDSAGAPAKEGNVLLFPADYRTWIQNGMSIRRTAIGTITQTGTFTVPRLLAGDFMILAVTETDPSDRGDPAFIENVARSATRVSIVEGQSRTIDLTVVKVTR
jgi:hypothetical protein